MRSFEERLREYDRQGILGKWHLDGDTLEDAFLGCGSFGRVYKIYCEERDSRGGRERYQNALKIMAIDAENCECDPDAPNLQRKLDRRLAKADHEIKIMKRLEGESNIAYFQSSQIIERTDTREKSWDVLICMERLIVLKDYLRANELVPGSAAFLRKILYIWEELVSALRVCEKNAIVHRDVKPGNVFYSPNTDHFKLSDFGEAVRGNVRPGEPMRGTKAYISPEIYNAAGADGRADAYSLAIMIYELLNGGFRPFEQEARIHSTGMEREIEERAYEMRLKQKRPIPPLKGAPSDVNAVLLKCLQYDPDKRFENCTQLKDAVSALRMKYDRMPAARGRTRLLPMALGALAVVALGVGAFFVFRPDSADRALPEATVQETAAPTLSAQPTAGSTSPIPSRSPTEAVPDEFRVTLYFENDGLCVASDGAADVLGGFVVEQGAAEPEDFLLTVDGEPVEADIWEETLGRFGFRASVQVQGDGDAPLRIALCDRASGEAYAFADWTFILATPEPKATPEPLPTLRLVLEGPVERKPAGVHLRGVIFADMPVDWGLVSLRVNGVEWPFAAEVSADGRRCVFDAEGSVGDAQTIRVQALFSDAEEDTAVDVEIPIATLAPIPVMALELDQKSVEADIGEIVLSGRLLLSGGTLGADGLELVVNGNRVTAEWEKDDGGYSFIARLEMDLTETQTLEVRVQASESNAVAPAQVSLPVLRPTATPAPTCTPKPFAPIVIEELAKLDGMWLGGSDTLVLRGTAEPDEALDVFLNEKIFGSYVVDGDGVFLVEIPISLLAQGECQVCVSYAGDEGVAETVELTVGVDTAAPELYVRQKSLSQHDAGVFVRVADESGVCQVTLRVDGNDVSSREVGDKTWSFLSLDGVGLSETSVIEVVALDRAGNRTEQTVPFARTVADIRVRNEAALTDQVYGPSKPVDIVLTAEADSLLRVSWGGCAWEVPTGDTSGFFRLTLDAAASVLRTQDGAEITGDALPELPQGESAVTIEYSSVGGQPVEGLSHVEIQLRYDSAAPELSVSPTRLLPGERKLQLAVAGENLPWEAEISLNDETIWRTQAPVAADGCTVELPPDAELPSGSELHVCVRDAASNQTEWTVPVEALMPISIENLGDFNGLLGAEQTVALDISAEDGAQLEFSVNGRSFVTQHTGGAAAYDVTGYLNDGENHITIRYAEENGYPAQAVAGLEASVTIRRDSESPQLEIEPALITRDTRELTVGVPNEADGYTLQLWIDGVLAVEGENISVIPVPEDNTLTEESEIRIVVTDTVGNASQAQLRYEDSSVLEEALVESYDADFGEAAPGETFATDIYVLCSDYDMGDGYVTVHLESDAQSRACVFERAQAEDAQRLSELYARGVLDRDYANAAYAITSVTVPANCPGGDYRLIVKVESEHDTYAFEAGLISVTSLQEADARETYVDMTAGYAIGFDPMAQDTFRADSVVLTGWVCRHSGEVPYFGRYDVLDSLGRSIWTDYSETDSGELTQFDRKDINEKVPGLSDCVLDDAGFVLNLDLSEAGLMDGQNYVIQIYSSNRTGTEWETIRMPIHIDEAANPIDPESVEAFIQELTPPAPTVEPSETNGTGEAEAETE